MSIEFKIRLQNWKKKLQRFKNDGIMTILLNSNCDWQYMLTLIGKPNIWSETIKKIWDIESNNVVNYKHRSISKE